MTDEELVKHLRDLGDHAGFEPDMYHTAANRIEKLEGQLQIARLDVNESDAYAFWLEAKMAKAIDFVRRTIRYSGSNGDDFLAEMGRETLLALKGESDD